MSNVVTWDFQERLAFSLGIGDEANLAAFYRRVWPEMLSAVRIDANSKWQKAGVDRMVILPGMKQILIDEKMRAKDYGDILLEEWSVWRGEAHPSNRIGWALDPDKQCDYVLYAVPSAKPIPKAYLLPFEILRLTFEHNRGAWKETPPVQNRGYVTLNRSVTWEVLAKAMQQQMQRRWATGEPIFPSKRIVDDNLLLNFAEAS